MLSVVRRSNNGERGEPTLFWKNVDGTEVAPAGANAKACHWGGGGLLEERDALWHRPLGVSLLRPTLWGPWYAATRISAPTFMPGDRVEGKPRMAGVCCMLISFMSDAPNESCTSMAPARVGSWAR